MKKMLGLLALTTAVSAIATADQDTLKSFKVDTNARYQYSDFSGEDANQMGNEGFKKENRRRTRFYKTVSGTLVLSDEFGLEADFKVLHRNQTMRAGNEKLRKSVLWNPYFALRKDVQLGALDTTFKFSYENETTRPKGADGKYATSGNWNEFRIGPAFKLDLLGQNIKVDTGLVYFNTKGSADNDLGYSGNEFAKGRAEGWGLDLSLGTSGTIAEGGFGKITYGLDFGNKYRHTNSKLASRPDSGNYKNLYMDYIQQVRYTTPEVLGGLTGFVGLQNEWEKHTGSKRVDYENTFDVLLGAGYKLGFDTPVGKVTVNPYTSYSVLNRTTTKVKGESDNKRKTVERNEIRAGLSVGLDLD